MTELDRTVEYSYDSLYRLTSETITEGEKVTVYTYAYDNVSNRILKTENGVETVYTYNALNQLVSDSETSYEYDLNGNLVRVIGSAQSALYEYNAENKLVRATVQNGVLVTEESYTYDYQGNRTSKTTHRSDGVTEYVKYLNDNSSLTNVLAEMGSEGSVQAYYTIGADLISQERDGKVSVYLYDGHGSVVGLANESGVVTDTYCYDAFGNLLDSTGSTKNCYRYCGEQFDETTGLYYLRARYMDTSTGRFISQDSYAGSISDSVSLHRYLYCSSNPVMNIDPSGYSVENDAYYFQQAWLSVEQAQEYIQRLLSSSTNEAAHNAAVIAIGKELLHQLTLTAVEYALASFFDQIFIPEISRSVAHGIVTSLDLAYEIEIDGLSKNTENIQPYEVTTYEDFRDRSVKGDDLEGHELWQFANQNEMGLANSRLSSPESKNNIVIALPHGVHTIFNSEQKKFNAKQQDAIVNVIANIEILFKNTSVPMMTKLNGAIESIKYCLSII